MASFNLHTFFHNSTNDRTEGGKVNIPSNREDWPDEWKQSVKKVYANFDLVELCEVNKNSPLVEVLRKRDAGKVRHSKQKISLRDLSHILFCAYGKFTREKETKRVVPSAGGLYPLQIYIIAREVESLTTGIYHYSPTSYILEPVIMSSKKKLDVFFSEATQYQFLWDRSVIIVITAMTTVPISKYGSRAYRYLLLEAGHVGQNISLACADLDKSVLPVGSFNEDFFESELGLLDGNERALYSFFL